MTTAAIVRRDALLSPCRTYRYALWRTWDPIMPGVLFIGLNPSTADESVDDPTIRRCVRFARDWGYGGVTVANLYAYRATKPRQLLDVVDPVGPENDEQLLSLAESSGLVVAAWGADPGPIAVRPAQVLELVGEMHALGLTKEGQPRHPLYMPAATTPTRWEPQVLYG